MRRCCAVVMLRCCEATLPFSNFTTTSDKMKIKVKAKVKKIRVKLESNTSIKATGVMLIYLLLSCLELPCTFKVKKFQFSFSPVNNL